MQDRLDGLHYDTGELTVLVGRILHRWKTNRTKELVRDKFWTGQVGDVIVRATSCRLLLHENDVTKETLRGDQCLCFIRNRTLELEKLTMFLENSKTFQRCLDRWKFVAWEPPNGSMVNRHWNEMQQISK